MHSVLFVTKDQAEFNYYQGVVAHLKKAGIPTSIVAEAISLDKWLQDGHEVYGGKPAPEFFDVNTGIRHDIDPAQVLAELKPRVVMAGLARPIHLGEKFAQAVAEYNRGVKNPHERIILGFVEDLWGVHARCSIVPDFICTLDERGVQHIKAKPKYVSTSVFATGHTGIDDLINLKSDPTIDAIASNFSHVVLMCGQDFSTTPMLEGLLEALDRKDEYLLIVRLHPKWSRVTEETVGTEQDPDKRAGFERQLSASNYWRRIIFNAKMGEVLLVRSDVTTRQIMPSVHYVVGIFSNTLFESAVLGRIPVSWISPLGRTMMAQELDGITRYPLVEYGMAIEVETADDYLTKVPAFGSDGHKRMMSITREKFNPGGSSKTVAEIIASYLN